MDWHLIQHGLGRIGIFLVTSYCRNQVNFKVMMSFLAELQTSPLPVVIKQTKQMKQVLFNW